MFNVNLLNDPGKQVEGMDVKLIVSKKNNFDSDLDNNDEENSEQKASQNRINVVLFLMFILFVVGLAYYFLILL